MDEGYLLVGNIRYYDDVTMKYYTNILLIKTDDVGTQEWMKTIALKNRSYATCVNRNDD